MEKFKPNLISNNDKGVEEIIRIVESTYKPSEYLIPFKKDGCRIELIDAHVLGRSLKSPGSALVIERFQLLADLCEELGIILEGEFYSHGMSFNEIYRFFANTDVTRDSERKKLENYSKQFLLGYDDGKPSYSKIKDFDQYKDSGKSTRLDEEFPGRSIDWLCTFHEDLKIHWFDGIVIDEPALGYADRMYEIASRLMPYWNDISKVLVIAPTHTCDTSDEIMNLYYQALDQGYEGLVLTHRDHVFKYGRTTLNEGTLLKMKDDKNVYDGVIIGIEEGTNIKEGKERTKNELGYSKTSKCKGDREPSGMAKGFLTSYKGEQFIVSLKGFDNESKVELLQNKEKYIGKHFQYTAMKPLKVVPRSAYFKCWRDDK